MDELLRFTVIRPAEAVEDRFQIKPSTTPPSPGPGVAASAPPTHPGTLDAILARTNFKTAHLTFVNGLGDGPDYQVTDINTASEQKFGKKPGPLVATSEWKSDLAVLSDAAVQILQAGHDRPSASPKLVRILQGVDLVGRVAAGATGTLRRRPVELAPPPPATPLVPDDGELEGQAQYEPGDAADAPDTAGAYPGTVQQPEIPLTPGLYASRGMAFELTANVEDDSGYGTSPTGELPFGKVGTLRPVGVGDLIVVREHILRYEGGELSHIENVLKSELRERETRRLDRVEDTVSTETETAKEEERDTQTTDRFSLQREASSVVKEDSSLKTGLSVTARYGFSVEVKADVAVALNKSEETSVKQASAVSRDVTSRAASKLSEKSKQAHIRKTIAEFEEFNKHAFDNKTSAGGVGNANISGLYQWIDRISRAQMYNYGSRVLFDTVVPEPAAFLIDTVRRQGQSTLVAELPVALTEKPSDLTNINYQGVAKQYRTTGIEPPPPAWTTVGKVVEAQTNEEPGALNKTIEIPVPDGYEGVALHWAYKGNGLAPSGGSTFPSVDVAVGTSGTWAGDKYTFTDRVRSSLGVGLSAFKTRNFAGALGLKCERTSDHFEKWQHKTYDSIVTAYTAMKQAYDKAVAEAEVRGLSAPQGRNPAENRDLILGELKKACITLLAQDHFEGLGAIETSTTDAIPQISLDRTKKQGDYIRFFEQAFEWENMQYIFYPYFWAQKSRWRARALVSNSDPTFAEFLRAGAARVVFPVRPGFEDDVRYFLQYGKIWGGGPVPGLNQPDYVPISEEISRATGAPGDERAVGKPWEVRVPTELVRLKTKTQLPAWEQDASGVWKETSATVES